MSYTTARIMVPPCTHTKADICTNAYKCIFVPYFFYILKYDVGTNGIFDTTAGIIFPLTETAIGSSTLLYSVDIYPIARGLPKQGPNPPEVISPLYGC